MTEDDREDFVAMLSSTLDLYGRKLSAGAYSIWFESMRGWPLGEVRAAFATWVSGGKPSAPVPADLVKLLQTNDGWVEAEEAWSIVSQTMEDERVTVFWTAPMQVAFGAALGLRDDMIAARMAFREVYNRELTSARSRGERPVWQMSPGADPEMRRAAVEEAARLGRITEAQRLALAPPERWPALHHSIAKLLRRPDEPGGGPEL